MLLTALSPLLGLARGRFHSIGNVLLVAQTLVCQNNGLLNKPMKAKVLAVALASAMVGRCGLAQHSLNIHIDSANTTNGMVTINGGDSRQPTTPFLFEWGDSSNIHGFFPQSHTYADVLSNYTITVTAFYDDASTDSVQVQLSWFKPAQDSNITNFQSVLFGPLTTLNLMVSSVNSGTGEVSVNGGDSRQPSSPFQWDWGDGSVSSGFFPQTHTYASPSNRVVSVTASYQDGSTGTAQVVVWFAPPAVQQVLLPTDTAVTVPMSFPTLTSRNGYGFSPTLTNYVPGIFGIISRPTIEYVLSAASAIERDFVNENYVRVNGAFQQVVLCDPGVSGFYSLWYSSPIAFSGGNTNALAGNIPWTFYFNEMGKNFTLNSPSNYWFGGKIDGNANAIISESLGGIFEIAAAYELINHGATLGLGADLIADIRNSAILAASIVRANYYDYTNNGSVFHSWNNGTVIPDVTIGTFSTISYKFLQHAEQDGQAYRVPLKRLMQALQLFNSDWLNSFAPSEDNAAADSFRATLWVAALSCAFQSDLRAEFEPLNFPVSAVTFTNLYAQMSALPKVTDTPHQLRSLRISNSVPSLSVVGPAFRFYSIQASTDPATKNWTNIGTVFNAGTTSFWSDVPVSSARRFYRSALWP